MKNANRNNRQVGGAVCLRRSGNMGYHYTDGTTVYVALADGIPNGGELMAESKTSNYDLFLTDGKDINFQRFREALCGNSGSNMVLIDQALKSISEETSGKVKRSTTESETIYCADYPWEAGYYDTTGHFNAAYYYRIAIANPTAGIWFKVESGKYYCFNTHCDYKYLIRGYSGTTGYDFVSTLVSLKSFAIVKIPDNVTHITVTLSYTSEEGNSTTIINQMLSEINSGTIKPTITYFPIKVGDGVTIAEDGTISASGSGTSITVDSALSDSSTNPVQNKVIKAELDKKIGTVPSAGADVVGGVKADNATAADTQPVRKGTDGKLYTAPASGGTTITVDSEMSDTSTNPVQNKVAKAYMDKFKAIILDRTISTTWTGSAVPYTQNITVLGNSVTDTSVIDIMLASTATEEQVAAFGKLNLQGGEQNARAITIRAFGTKNTVSIPIKVIVRGEP